MKRDLLKTITDRFINRRAKGYAAFLLGMGLLSANTLFAQNDGDLRSRLNNSGWGTANTWQKYVAASDSWITSDVAPTSTSNVTIRDGFTHTSNGSGYNTANLTVGEGNAAAGVGVLDGDTVKSVTITDPGKLSIFPTVTFIGAGTTLPSATVSSVKVTGAVWNDRGAGYTTATVSFGTGWAAGTAYSVGTQRSNGGNLYTVVTAGTSDAAGTGPSGTGKGITDGTVVWDYAGPAATATPVITDGKITAINITNPGSGYNSLPTLTVTGDGTTLASWTAQIGVEAVKITTGGAGYTTPPTVAFGTILQVGNSSNNRTVTVNGDLAFKKNAVLFTNGGRTETLVVGGNITAETPIDFFMQTPGSVASTTVQFTKSGTSTVTGALKFRNITFSANTVVVPPTTFNIAGTISKPTATAFPGGIDVSNATVNLLPYPSATAVTQPDSVFLNGVVKDINISNGAGVTLTQSLNITSSWNQTAGVVTLKPGTTITIPSPTAITGAFGTTCYIATDTSVVNGTTGLLKIQNISTPTLFPVGHKTNYFPVTVSPTSASTFSVASFTGATDNGAPNGTATTDKTNLVDAIYIVNRNAGSGNATLTFGFPAALKGAGFASIQNNQLGISHFNGAGWDPVTGYGDNTQNTATATFSNFSPFRVEVNMSAVPVKLGNITAAKVNGQVVLNWNVYTEVNVNKYEVERSVDGVTFNAIGSVSATNSSSYSLTDKAPSAGKNLYRLKSIDKDGSYAYSKVLLVDFGRNGANVHISPNPVTHGYFTVRLANMKAGKVSVRMFSNLGQLVMDQKIDYNGSEDNQLINLPGNVARGNYHLVITDGLNSQKASIAIQ